MSQPFENPRFGLRGAICAVLMAFPTAALVALFFRFPIPFSAYESGIDVVPRALLATIFYGLLGGFPVLALGGYMAGVVAVRIGGENQQKTNRLMIIFSSAISFLGIMYLAVLDKIIGPW